MNTYLEELDETDKLISDFVGTDNDIALGKVCGNCRHNLHNKKECKAFTKIKGMWNSCNCTESTVACKIRVKIKTNAIPNKKIGKPKSESKSTNQIITETESLFKKQL